jgi:hypothetical protein
MVIRQDLGEDGLSTYKGIIHAFICKDQEVP